MKRDIIKWPVSELKNNYHNIGFPEFQREPTVWNLDKKRRLIDSIFRGFDISPIYLYKKGENSYDCIDGRQRINAIWSFMGLNEGIDKDNGFKINIENIIYKDEGTALGKLLDRIKNKGYKELKGETKIFDNYQTNIVMIDTKLENILELNLLFSRLQLGDTLNSGEKIHAMSGAMRDFVFNKRPKGIQDHTFFTSISTPTYRRYAREQIAAQILLNYFSINSEKKDFTRSRYVDLQLFFKEKSYLNKQDKKLIKKVMDILNKICEVLGVDLAIIENRAIAVSTFLFMAELINKVKEPELNLKLIRFKEFMKEFVATLKWQVKAHHDLNEAKEYHDILNGFQNYVTQAAGETYAIRNRHNFINKYFDYFSKKGKIIGDEEYDRNPEHKKPAREERNQVTFKRLKLVDSL